MRGEGRRGEEGRGEDNHHGEVILGSHLGASPLNSLNLSGVPYSSTYCRVYVLRYVKNSNKVVIRE